MLDNLQLRRPLLLEFLTDSKMQAKLTRLSKGRVSRLATAVQEPATYLPTPIASYEFTSVRGTLP